MISVNSAVVLWFQVWGVEATAVLIIGFATEPLPGLELLVDVSIFTLALCL